MVEPTEAFPLQWPAGVKRSSSQIRAPFTQTVASAQESLQAELRRLGARNVVISSDVGPRKADGSLYARAKTNPSDPGIAVYFDLNGRRTCFACDKWIGIHNNVHAIAKTIEAMRGTDRWGVAEAADRAFTGFAALPAREAIAPKRHWWDVLADGDPFADDDVVEARYRELAKRFGPDMPEEDHARMVEINLARDEWRASR